MRVPTGAWRGTTVQELVLVWDLSWELYCRGGNCRGPWRLGAASRFLAVGAWGHSSARGAAGVSTRKQKQGFWHPGYSSMGLRHWQSSALTCGQAGRSE